jgi:myosin heavy subunit
MTQTQEEHCIPIAISAPPVKDMNVIPHMLRQSNYARTATEMGSGHVHVQVSRHMDVQPHSSNDHQTMDLWPTVTEARLPVYQHESDWNKHAIVASVAGLETKLAELDTQIRTQGPSEPAGHAVMRQLQDHANIIRENGRLTTTTQQKHAETTALTHQICSELNKDIESHEADLRSYQADMSKLTKKHANSAMLTHEICSKLNSKDEEHDKRYTVLEANLSLLKEKDAVAHSLLRKMLTMLGQHEETMSKMQAAQPHEQQVLLDALCDALDHTKSKMLSFENTQAEMQKVLRQFKSGQLSLGQSSDTQSLHERLDRYMNMSKQMDSQFSTSLASQERKMQALERAHEQSLREQQRKILDLERAHEQSLREQQSKILDLERAHQLALQNQQNNLKQLEQNVLASKNEQYQLSDLAAKVQELSLQQLNNSQHASITRATERDVKLLQHEVRSIHALKRDVEDIHQNMQDHANAVRCDLKKAESSARLRDSSTDAMHRDMQHMKSQINFFVDAHKSNTSKQDIASLGEQFKEMRKDMTLQDLRVDKAHVHVAELRKRMNA